MKSTFIYLCPIKYIHESNFSDVTKAKKRNQRNKTQVDGIMSVESKTAMANIDKLILWMSYRYFVNGYDREDIIQEINLVRERVTKKWRCDGGASYTTYFTKAVKKHFWKLIRKNAVVDLLPELDYYTEEPSFALSDSLKLIRCLKHNKTKQVLLNIVNLVERNADVNPTGNGVVAQSAGITGERVRQLLVNARNTTALRQLRKVLTTY